MTDGGGVSASQPPPRPAPLNGTPLPRHLAGGRCIACGYDIQGLHRSERCPECGTPVNRSVLGDPLEYTPRPKLRQLSRGLWLAAAGLAGAPALGLVPIVGVLLVVFSTLGVWLATARPAVRAGMPAKRSLQDYLRVSLRVLTVVFFPLGCVATLALAQLLSGWYRLGFGSTGRDDAIAVATLAVAGTVWVARHGLWLWWLLLLARRVPSADIVRGVGWAALLGGLGVASLTLLGGIGGFATHTIVLPPLCGFIPLAVLLIVGWYAAALLSTVALAQCVGGLSRGRPRGEGPVLLDTANRSGRPVVVIKKPAAEGGPEEALGEQPPN